MLPVFAVKAFDFQLDWQVEAMGIEAPAIRVAARLVKAFDAAGRTEQMFGGARPEAIAGQ